MKLGSLDNHRQEPWKAPLPNFIEHLYEKRFGRMRPEVVRSIEETAKLQAAKRASKKAAKAATTVPEVPAGGAAAESTETPSSER